jgi:hypothetical protein
LNDLRQMDVLESQIAVARQVGFSDHEIAEFLRRHISIPATQIQACARSLISFLRLDFSQDEGDYFHSMLG